MSGTAVSRLLQILLTVSSMRQTAIFVEQTLLQSTISATVQSLNISITLRMLMVMLLILLMLTARLLSPILMTLLVLRKTLTIPTQMLSATAVNTMTRKLLLFISGRGIIRLQSEDLLQETVTRVKSAIR